MARADTIRSVGKVLHTVGNLALDRERARWQDFPVTPDEFTPNWLTGVLATRYPGIAVESFKILDKHSGTTSRARLSIQYADGSIRTDAPSTVFVKLTPAAFVQRLFLSIVGIGHNELRFYHSTRSSVPVRSPRVHGLQSLGSGRYFVLLLEDVTAPGTRLTTVGDRASLQDAQEVVKALATLHAAFWESHRFRTDLSWVPNPQSRKKNLAWERFATGSMIKIAKRNFASEFSTGFSEIANLCSKQRDELESLWSQGDRTLIHGDCHIGNLFFEPEGVGFLDWQVCANAPGMRDVSYFLCNSFPTELRRAHEVELIKGYLEELRSHGVTPPSFEAAWRQHRLFALYTWIAAAFTAAAGGGLQSRKIGIAGLRRATKAAEDLESAACVRESA